MRTNELMLYKHMENGQILQDITFLIENYQNDYYNMEDMKEFVAYARKLLRVINKIEKYLENGESEKALELVRELKEDTQKDIEA